MDRVEGALLLGQPTLDRVKPLSNSWLAEPHLGDLQLRLPARRGRRVRIVDETEVHECPAPHPRAAPRVSEGIRGLHARHHKGDGDGHGLPECRRPAARTPCRPTDAAASPRPHDHRCNRDTGTPRATRGEQVLAAAAYLRTAADCSKVSAVATTRSRAQKKSTSNCPTESPRRPVGRWTRRRGRSARPSRYLRTATRRGAARASAQVGGSAAIAAEPAADRGRRGSRTPPVGGPCVTPPGHDKLRAARDAAYSPRLFVAVHDQHGGDPSAVDAAHVERGTRSAAVTDVPSARSTASGEVARDRFALRESWRSPAARRVIADDRSACFPGQAPKLRFARRLRDASAPSTLTPAAFDEDGCRQHGG